MNDIIYGVTEEKHKYNGVERITYGVAAYSNEEDEEMLTILISVSHVTTDKNRMIDFVEKCNRLGLSLIHLEFICLYA